MGFEALSRNAKSVTMVEFSSIPYKALQQNKALLKADAAETLQLDALQFLAKNAQKFDVIFCDPPYNKAWLDKLLPLLQSHLAESGVVYAEAEYALKDSAQWQVIKHGKAGTVHYHLLRKVRDSINGLF